MVSDSAVWPAQDAPQMMSRRGIPEAVMVPLNQWHQCSTREFALKDLLLADGARFDMELPERGQRNHRGVDAP